MSAADFLNAIPPISDDVWPRIGPKKMRAAGLTCSADHCDSPVRCKGLCAVHYSRLVTYGRLTLLEQPTVEQRFWSKVIEIHGCWVWMDDLGWYGYGTFWIDRRHPVRSHRWAYERFVGPIPDDLPLDHLCRNRACCNPVHLEPVTQAENVRRGAAVRLSCVNGHRFTEDNTYRDPKHGARQCRICRREADRLRRKR